MLPRDLEAARKHWVEGPLPHQWQRFEKFGITQELYEAWSKTMRRPVYEWQEQKWSPTNTAETMTASKKLRKIAEEAFNNFLAAHPELPTQAIRHLVREVVEEYHFQQGMASPTGKAEAIQTAVDIFMDIAFHLYRDGILPPSQNIQETQAAARDAVEKIGDI